MARTAWRRCEPRKVSLAALTTAHLCCMHHLPRCHWVTMTFDDQLTSVQRSKNM